MLFRTSSVFLFTLTASAANYERKDGAMQAGKIECPSDALVLQRNHITPISSPNANVTCTEVELTIFSDNSNYTYTADIINGNKSCDTYPRQYVTLPSNASSAATAARLLWKCSGADVYCLLVGISDATDSALVSSSTSAPSALDFVISQTCSFGAKASTAAGAPSFSSGTAASSSFAGDRSMYPTTGGNVPTGLATTQGQDRSPTTTLTSGPEATGTMNHDHDMPTSTSPLGGSATSVFGAPDVTRGTTNEPANVPMATSQEMPAVTEATTDNSNNAPDMTGTATNATHHASNTAEAAVPTKTAGSEDNASVNSSTGLATSSNPTGHGAPTCTCQGT